MKDNLFESKEIEESVLSGLTMDEDVCRRHLGKLGEDDFSDDRCKEYYKIVKRLVDKGGRVDIIIMLSEISGSNVLKRGDVLSISERLDSVDMIGEYVEKLLEISGKRKLRRVLSDVSKLLVDGDKMLSDVIGTMRRKVDKIGFGSIKEGREIMEIAQGVIKKQEEMKEGRLKMMTLTGIERFDKHVDVDYGEFITIPSGSGIGKSWFASLIACHMGVECNKHVHVMSMEMSDEVVFQRIISRYAGVEPRDFRKGEVNIGDKRFLSAVDKVVESNIRIMDKSSYTIGELESYVSKWKSKGEMDVMILDHGLYLDFGGGRDNKADRIGAVTKRLKKCARDYGVVIIMLWQMDKAVNKAKYGKPGQVNIRDAQSVFDESDCCLMLWRPEKFGVTKIKGESSKDVIVVIVEKYRHGGGGREIPFEFKPDRGGFVEWRKDIEEGFVKREELLPYN